jgi:hypothetical protein
VTDGTVGRLKEYKCGARSNVFLAIPIAVIMYAVIIGGKTKDTHDSGFSCANNGVVAIAGRDQLTQDIANKYCVGDIKKANAALIKKYRGPVIPRWTFIDVESLGKTK